MEIVYFAGGHFFVKFRIEKAMHLVKEWFLINRLTPNLSYQKDLK
ncbi:hypothetical protein AB5I83_12880 [Mesobacillus sp. LC4]